MLSGCEMGALLSAKYQCKGGKVGVGTWRMVRVRNRSFQKLNLKLNENSTLIVSKRRWEFDDFHDRTLSRLFLVQVPRISFSCRSSYGPQLSISTLIYKNTYIQSSSFSSLIATSTSPHSLL